MPSTLPDPRYTQLRTWYEQLTARIAATDKDIGRSVYEYERQLHRERLAELMADRELITAYLDALERDQPLPGLWPPDFITTDLLAAPSTRIQFKSGRCDFYRHIPLPPNYIPRPELLAEVRERLLAGMGGLALTSAIQVKQADVLHGMGGIGKSVLARALCEDTDVQTAFHDGILWATLGQTPNLTARLREWIETLGGAVGQTAPTLDQLRNTLAEALRDKACLLIVDDAWRKAHLEPFCAGGPACRLLITTRDAALAEGLDAGVYPVPVMTPDQAVALLEEWAQGSLAEVEAEVKAEIIRRLGYLPLAVRLGGAQLRQKLPAEWLTSFDARKLKTIRVETVHDSLEATFNQSLDDLELRERYLYFSLSIFRKDQEIPLTSAAELWQVLEGLNRFESAALIQKFARRGLLQIKSLQLDSTTQITLMLHDLLRDFAPDTLRQWRDAVAVSRIPAEPTPSLFEGTQIRVFLSYAREDSAHVLRLYDRLSSTGFRPWMDKRDLVGGQKWRDEIDKAIRQSHFVLVCLSSSAVKKRGYLQKEINLALDRSMEMLHEDVFLIPVRLEPCEMPQRLADLQWIDYFEVEGWTRLLEAIRRGMELRKDQRG